jgi:metal-responsive CopG/Arc/MetJ family transcriptional regulator
MKSSMVEFDLQEDLLREIDREAKMHARSRTDVIQEAVRAYVVKKKSWSNLLSKGRSIAKDRCLTPEDVEREIADYRKVKSSC